jgi:hypothetical protein
MFSQVWVVENKFDVQTEIAEVGGPLKKSIDQMQDIRSLVRWGYPIRDVY